MMKMDGRDSAECQNWEKRDIMVIFGIVKLEKRQIATVLIFSNLLKGEKNVKGEKKEMQWPNME